MSNLQHGAFAGAAGGAPAPAPPLLMHWTHNDGRFVDEHVKAMIYWASAKLKLVVMRFWGCSMRYDKYSTDPNSLSRGLRGAERLQYSFDAKLLQTQQLTASRQATRPIIGYMAMRGTYRARGAYRGNVDRCRFGTTLNGITAMHVFTSPLDALRHPALPCDECDGTGFFLLVCRLNPGVSLLCPRTALNKELQVFVTVGPAAGARKFESIVWRTQHMHGEACSVLADNLVHVVDYVQIKRTVLPEERAGVNAALAAAGGPCTLRSILAANLRWSGNAAGGSAAGAAPAPMQVDGNDEAAAAAALLQLAGTAAVQRARGDYAGVEAAVFASLRERPTLPSVLCDVAEADEQAGFPDLLPVRVASRLLLRDDPDFVEIATHFYGRHDDVQRDFMGALRSASHNYVLRDGEDVRAISEVDAGTGKAVTVYRIDAVYEKTTKPNEHMFEAERKQDFRRDQTLQRYFHGTDLEAAEVIMQYGFDRAQSGGRICVSRDAQQQMSDGRSVPRELVAGSGVRQKYVLVCKTTVDDWGMVLRTCDGSRRGYHMMDELCDVLKVDTYQDVPGRQQYFAVLCESMVCVTHLVVLSEVKRSDLAELAELELDAGAFGEEWCCAGVGAD